MLSTYLLLLLIQCLPPLSHNLTAIRVQQHAQKKKDIKVFSNVIPPFDFFLLEELQVLVCVPICDPYQEFMTT